MVREMVLKVAMLERSWTVSHVACAYVGEYVHGWEGRLLGVTRLADSVMLHIALQLC